MKPIYVAILGLLGIAAVCVTGAAYLIDVCVFLLKASDFLRVYAHRRQFYYSF
jgi:hypothetical protein